MFSSTFVNGAILFKINKKETKKTTNSHPQIGRIYISSQKKELKVMASLKLLKWACIIITAFLTTYLLIDPAVVKIIPYMFEKRIPANEIHGAFTNWISQLDKIIDKP
tara:strand:- start:4675 stop:4998 length:324 start_codon:yes stop_codon:yes gene_type:complete